ncbi:MAG: hypothetical protein N3J91_13405 [Verrucomicrobiae bacterium]|nr:hypothetical protein [Verrucomicrobiae bacterium]
MARSASKKNVLRRPPAPLPEAVVAARALALGLPRFAVRLAGGARLKPSAFPGPRRVCE